MATGHGDLQCLPAEQSSPLPNSVAPQPRRVRIRLWISDGEIHEESWAGEGNRKGRTDSPGHSITRAGFLGRCVLFLQDAPIPFDEWINRLAEKVRGNFFAV